MAAQARSLLESSEPNIWHENLVRYSEAVRLVSEAKKKTELIDHDDWLWKTFPECVKNRSPELITKDELTRIMTWKLLRGKNRPTLLSLIRQNEESTVRTVTTNAIQQLRSGNWHEALKILTELRGVGPGTLLSPSHSPHSFLSHSFSNSFAACP
jgi:hypothetical protein